MVKKQRIDIKMNDKPKDDSLPVKPPAPLQIDYNKENMLRKRTSTLRTRINLWFCDRLGVTSVHDFDDLFNAVDTFFVYSMRRFKEVDDFAKAQACFDKSMAETLEKHRKDDVADEESNKRNVYG
jgi:hypothetical protein